MDASQASLREIHLVPHSHHDYAWVYPRQWHVWRYIGLFGEVLDWLEENPETTWFIDNVIHSLQPFLSACPEQAERMKRLVKAGRIGVANGGYSLARPSYVGEETFVRNCAEGVRWFRNYFGIDGPAFFFNLDTACGQSQLPQILRLCGHRYYRFQRPELSLDGRGVPRQFYWRGLDGSAVLVARGFGGGMLSAAYTNGDYEKDWTDIRAAFFREEIAPRRPEGCAAAGVEMLPYGCDDSRPRLNWYDKPIRLLEFVKEWKLREKIPLFFSTPDVYFQALEKEELPVVAGPLDIAELSFNLPVKGNRSMWRRRFTMDRLLTQLETLCVLAASKGMPYPHEELHALWKELFKITGHAIEWVDEDSDKELTLIATHAEATAELLIRQALRYIGQAARYTDGLLYMVVNTAAFDREECAELVLADPLRGLKGFYLTDTVGNRLEFQIIDAVTHDEVPKEQRRCDCSAVRAVVRVRVPALSCTGIYLHPEEGEAPRPLTMRTGDSVQIDTGGLSVRFEKGLLRSVRADDEAAVYQGGAGGLLSPKFYRTSPSAGWMLHNQPLSIDSFCPERWKLRENGPVRWIYETEGSLGEHRARLIYTLEKGRSGVDCHLVIDSRPADGIFVASVPCDGCCVPEGDIYFGMEPRDVRRTSCSPAEVDLDGQCFAKSFLRFTCSGHLLSLVSGDCSMYYRHDVSANTLSLILTRTTRMADKTESWFRHCPSSFEVKGEHSYRFSLAFGGKPGDISRYRQTLSYPLLTTVKNGRGGAVVLEAPLVRLSADNVVVTALYKEDNRTVLRFYETEGKECEVGLTVSLPFHRAYRANLLLEEIFDEACAFDAEQGSVRLAVSPWKIVTVVLEE